MAKRRRANLPDFAVVIWSGLLRSWRWIKQCGGVWIRKMQGAQENSNMPLKRGRYPQAPERLQKMVYAEQWTRFPFKVSRTSAVGCALWNNYLVFMYSLYLNELKSLQVQTPRVTDRCPFALSHCISKVNNRYTWVHCVQCFIRKQVQWNKFDVLNIPLRLSIIFTAQLYFKSYHCTHYATCIVFRWSKDDVPNGQ